MQGESWIEPRTATDEGDGLGELVAGVRVVPSHARRVVSELLRFGGSGTSEWPGLSGYEPSELPQGAANRFFAGAIVDFQIKAEQAWENGRKLAEDITGDPRNMWTIVASMDADEWDALHERPETRMHKYKWAHSKVRRIAQSIVEDYDGDVRRIWNDGADEEEILNRLGRLGDKGVGEQLSRMILGALLDTGNAYPPADIKADVHVTRVIGRLFGCDGPMRPVQAIAVTRHLRPENPWDLDAGLYQTGRSVCHKDGPECDACEISSACRSKGMVQ